MSAQGVSSFTHLTEAALKQCIQDKLPQYTSIVPDKLAELDDFRYNLQPSKKDGSPTLTKTELLSLVEWKLHHGTFRPALKNLVASNSEDTVADIIQEAFTLIPSGAPKENDVKYSLAVLTKLRGIGPATASLVLSVLRPDEIPFFSDELFRWAMWEDGSGKGWDRGIKYSVKEYFELFNRVAGVRETTDAEVRAVELEKVAYVLGKSAGGKRITKREKSETKPESKASTKRVAEDESQANPEKKAKVTAGTETRSTRSSARNRARQE
jgi:hypothetical protein